MICLAYFRLLLPLKLGIFSGDRMFPLRAEVCDKERSQEPHQAGRVHKERSQEPYEVGPAHFWM